MAVKSPVQAGGQCAQFAISALLSRQGHFRGDACLLLLPGDHVLRRKGVMPPENNGISRNLRIQPGSGRRRPGRKQASPGAAQALRRDGPDAWAEW